MPIALRWLGEHPGLIEEIAPRHHREWAHLYADWDLPRVTAELRAHRTDGGLPTTIAAFEGERFLGSASLVLDDLPTHPELGPWLASVYVLPEHRGKGVAAALVARAVEVASSHADQLYLFTESARHFFEGHGFEVWAHDVLRGLPITVMSRKLRRA